MKTWRNDKRRVRTSVVSRRAVVVAGLLALALLPAGAAWAQVVSAGWKNDADGDWSVAGNWTGSSGAATGTTGIASFTNAITGARTVTVDSSPWTIKSLIFTNNSAGNAYGWTVTGGTLNLAAASTFTVNGAASTATVASALSGVDLAKAGSGTLILTGNSGVGVVGLTGGGTLVLNGGTMTNVAAPTLANGSSGNTLVVSNNAVWNLGGQKLTFCDNSGGSSLNNQLIVSGAVVSNVAGFTIGAHASTNCSFVITNGGKFFNGTASSVVGNSGSNVSALVTGDGSLWDNGGRDLSVTVIGQSNNLTVANYGVLTNVGTFYIAGNGGAGVNGSLAVSGGGKVYATNDFIMGSSATIGSVDIADGGLVYVGNRLRVGGTVSSNWSMTVRDGGLLEASTILVGNGAGTGNVLTVSSGGILQFTTATPSITLAAGAGNALVITNGTLSFRGIQSGALPNLTNNWVKTGGIGTNTISWQGANTLRLDNAFATNSLAGGYTFANNRGATNYTALELVNGTTAVIGTGLQMDGANGGALLFSNTTASIAGGVALAGAVPVSVTGGASTLNAVLSGSGGFVLAGGGTLTLTSNSTYSGATRLQDGTLRLTGAAALVSSNIFLAAAGVRLDVTGLTGGAGGTLTLASDQTLCGLGRVDGGLIVGSNATLMASATPSNGVAALTVSNLTLQAGGRLQVNVAARSGGYLDLQGGALVWAADAVLSINDDAYTPGDSYLLATNIVTAASSFEALTNATYTGQGSGGAYVVLAQDQGGGQTSLYLSAAIPEPAALSLLLLVVGAGVAWRRATG